MSVRVNFTFEKSEICIENSLKPKGDISGELWILNIEYRIKNIE